MSDTVHRLKPSADQGRKRGLARCFGQDLMKGEHAVGNGAPKHRLKSQPSPEEWQNEGSQRQGSIWHGGTSESNQKVAEVTSSGTSIFDPVLCELAYRWFCPKDGRILDPFAGGSVRGIVAAKLGYCYTGIDLSDRQLKANEEQAQTIVAANMPKWICGDSVNVKELAAGQYDLIFTCPPYADLEVYSDDPRDLSTMAYDAFIEAYRKIIADCVGMLKPNRFACIVVGDVRDKKGFYRNFVGDTISAFEDAGATLYNEAILVTAVGSLPIRVGRQFGAYRKLGKTHQNFLGFFKGDPKQIPVVLGEVEFTEELPDTGFASL